MAGLFDLVRRNAERSPGKVALEIADEHLTYGQLVRRVQALAHILRAEGVSPDSVTAICVEETAIAIIAVLAVWSAGGAYLPLDPSFPEEVLNKWLRRAGTRTIIIDEHSNGSLQAVRENGARVITINSSMGPPATDGKNWLEDPRQLAYVMFTSGSTGSPKAVAVEHRNILAYFTDALPSYVPIDSASRVLQLASFTFDPWLRDAVMPLAKGATVVLLEKQDRRDPERVLVALKQHRITHLLSATPAMVAGIMALPSFSADPPDLQWTLVSGESFLPLHAYGAQLRHLGRIINHFGLTETTLIATQTEVTPDRAASADIIGRPVPGVDVHVLGADLRQVSRGEVGELYIGGTGVSRGYVRAAALTAERFIADPFGVPGSRLYRTGDLARTRPDGSLEYVGRADRQINLRGTRIEPAEIELAIMSYPGVTAAVVITYDQPVQGAVLVAYVALMPDASVDSAELRAFLARDLPGHMVPAIYVFMDALPVGATGKVDRSALPEPPIRRDDHPKAMSKVERQMAAIWSEVLRIPNIGGAENFFDLGGHSLIATRIAAILRSELGFDFTTEHILQHPSVHALAENIPPPRSDEDLISRRHGSRYPVSLLQLGLLSCAPNGYQAAADDVACAFRLQGNVDVSRLGRAVAEVMRRHASLRTTFTLAAATEPSQVVRHRMRVPLTYSPCQGLDLAGLLSSALGRPFSITDGPLFEVVVFSQGPAEQIVLIRFSRLIADDASMDIFIREVSKFYARGEGPRIPSDDLSGHYAQFARQERAALGREQMDDCIRYWGNLLRNGNQAPAAHSRESVQESRQLTLPPVIVRPLHALGRAHGAGLSRVLEAALGLSLALTSGSQQAILAVAVTDRPVPEYRSAIGPFTYFGPVLVSLHEARTLGMLLDRMRGLASTQPSPLPLEFLQGKADIPEFLPLTRLIVRSSTPEPLRFPGVEATPIDVPLYTVRPAELRVSLTEDAGGLIGRVDSGPACPYDGRNVADLLTRLLTTVSGQEDMLLPVRVARGQGPDA